MKAALAQYFCATHSPHAPVATFADCSPLLKLIVGAESLSDDEVCVAGLARVHCTARA